MARRSAIAKAMLSISLSTLVCHQALVPGISGGRAHGPQQTEILQIARRPLLIGTSNLCGLTGWSEKASAFVDSTDMQNLETVTVTAGQDLDQTSLEDYAAMRDDRLRTDAYAAAITERVQNFQQNSQKHLQTSQQTTSESEKTSKLKPNPYGPVVLDLGTGPFALLATIAARAGARRVYALERTPQVAREATQFVRRAQLEEVISVIEGNSLEVTLPEKVGGKKCGEDV